MARSRLDEGRWVMSLPSSVSVPPSMCSSPAIRRNSVDLPQPEGPTNTMNSPGLMDRSMPLMARLSPKNFSMPLELEISHGVVSVYG